MTDIYEGKYGYNGPLARIPLNDKLWSNREQPLTREYLTSVGTCCGCRCTNCPYEPLHQRGSTEQNRIPLNEKETPKSLNNFYT